MSYFLSAQVPRRRDAPARWRWFALPIVLAMTAMSGDPSEPRHVADRFMVLYYDPSRVGEAAQLCTGAAKLRLEAEIKFMEGAPTPAPGDQPHTTFRLIYEDVSTTAQATHVYRVHLRTPDVPALYARVVLVEEGGRWLVSKFDEKERGS